METPSAYRDAFAGQDGGSRHPDLPWTAAGYLCHVVDNLRIWAERLAAAAAGGPSDIVPYDTDLLATGRDYARVPVLGALWSLDNAARDWHLAVTAAQRAGVVLQHPDRGEMTASDIAVHNAHDAYHHHWDIDRSLSWRAGSTAS